MLIRESLLMKVNKKLLLSLVLFIPLAGCNNMFKKHVKCDDQAATGLVTQVLQDDIARALDLELKALIKEGSIKDLDPTKLKVSAKSIQFTMADSRTDFIDPNSPKTTCSVDLVATIPSDLIRKSDEARTKINVISVDEQATNLNLNYENSKIKLTLEYVLQPTDKGDKIIAQLKNTQAMQTLISETLTYAFLKPQIEKNEIRSLEASKKNVVHTSTADDAAAAATIAADEAAIAENQEYYEDY